MLRHSKTDQFGQGAEVFLSKNDSPICPVQAMVKCLKARGTAEGALLLDKHRLPPTKQWLTHDLNSVLVKAKIDPSHYKGHSFQIGAATITAACGIPDSTINMLGRWSNNAYQTLAEQLAAIVVTMGKSLPWTVNTYYYYFNRAVVMILLVCLIHYYYTKVWFLFGDMLSKDKNIRAISKLMIWFYPYSYYLEESHPNRLCNQYKVINRIYYPQ